MSRYELPDPKCTHAKRSVRVTSGDLNGTGPHASTWVCDRDACIEDAKEWAYANSHIEPMLFYKDGDPAAPGLFDLDGAA